MAEPEGDLLQFGIPTVDWLFGVPHRAKPLTGDFVEIHGATNCGISVEPNHTTSLCLIGPDGTGKSLLALHFAARYAFHAHNLRAGVAKDIAKRMPHILYASTDLSFGKAKDHWNNFGLHYYQHFNPFPWRAESCYSPIELKSYEPVTLSSQKGKDKHLAEYFQQVSETEEKASDGLMPEVAFINLESATAGDDWGFLNRVIALLPPVTFGKHIPHLLVIDAVEGLETMVGQTDAYGQVRPRRSRIAQIFRTAARKCHLVLVCEESAAERLPEEFITDVVLRLHNRTNFEYHRRTLEITKARGQWHTRGEHPYAIRRGGEGSSSVKYDHPDDPPPPGSAKVDTAPKNDLTQVEATRNRSGQPTKRGRRTGVGANDQGQATSQNRCDRGGG